jgi:hypothetical protein
MPHTWGTGAGGVESDFAAEPARPPVRVASYRPDKQGRPTSPRVSELAVIKIGRICNGKKNYEQA